MNAIVRAHEGDKDRCYFERPAERLVLEGYRHWTAGYQNNSVVAWELAWRLYEQILGEANAKPALALRSGDRAMFELPFALLSERCSSRLP